MRSRLIIVIVIVISVISVFFMPTFKIGSFPFFNSLPKTSGRKTFDQYDRGYEYAHNRDGYIVKVGDHTAIMKLYGEEDQLMRITDEKGLEGDVILKKEIIEWSYEDNDTLLLTVLENEEQKLLRYPLK